MLFFDAHLGIGFLLFFVVSRRWEVPPARSERTSCIARSDDFNQRRFAKGKGLFQGGALAARQAEAEAVAVERLFALEQAWLEALREVQAALDAESAARERIIELDAQIAHARQRLELARRRYAQGQVAYLEVLSAQQAVNSAELEALAARNARFLQRVNLCRGLAANVAGVPPAPVLLRSDDEEPS